MPRFEGDLDGYLTAFCAAHPEWQGVPHTILATAPGDTTPTDWLSVDLLRAATRWARQQRYISWEFATDMETLCRRVEHQLASIDLESREGD